MAPHTVGHPAPVHSLLPGHLFGFSPLGNTKLILSNMSSNVKAYSHFIWLYSAVCFHVTPCVLHTVGNGHSVAAQTLLKDINPTADVRFGF